SCFWQEQIIAKAMNIEGTKIFFISEVNCNWFSVIASKKTEGQWLVKRNLTLEANRVSSRVADGAFTRKHPAHCEPLPNGRYRSIFHSVVCCAVRRAARRNGNMVRTNPVRAELRDRAEFQLVAVTHEDHPERSEGPPKRAHRAHKLNCTLVRLV